MTSQPAAVSPRDVASDTVHVFVCTGRFRSFAELRAFIDQTYAEDGDGVPSPFIREVGLTGYEPACVEAVVRPEGPIRVVELLAGASYDDQWLAKVGVDWEADAAICVFAPNRVSRPDRSSLRYVGAFEYNARSP